MKRKIVKHGNATLTVSLPSKWVKKLGLKQGDDIELLEERNALIINPEEQKALHSIEIEIESPEKFNPRAITRPYLLGYAEIKVIFKDPAVVNLIQEEISYLLGFEIIQVTEKYCLIKNISKGIEEEFENMLKRLLFLLYSTGQEIEEAMKSSQYDKLQLTLSKEKESNKISLFCRRVFNLHEYQGDKNPYILYTVATLAEAAMDEFRFIIEFLLSEKPKLHRKTLEFINHINEMNKTFNKLYGKYDEDQFMQFRQERKRIERELPHIYKLEKVDIYILNRLYNVQELVHHMTYF